MNFQEEELQQGGENRMKHAENLGKSYEITVIRITEPKISSIII